MQYSQLNIEQSSAKQDFHEESMHSIWLSHSLTVPPFPLGIFQGMLRPWLERPAGSLDEQSRALHLEIPYMSLEYFVSEIQSNLNQSLTFYYSSQY